MENEVSVQARELVRGGYDLHTHTEPSHFGRALDDFALLREASSLGMAGVMIKNHYEPTGARAALVNLCGMPAVAYGGVALNWPVGGLNPYAAESALKMGARIVWMPTLDAENCLRHGGMPDGFSRRPGIAILEENGKIKPCVQEIIEVVKGYGACLATGHLSLEESVALCRAGRAHNARMILTHPERRHTAIPRQVQVEMADLGVLIEKSWFNVAEGACTIQSMAETICAIGSERVYLCTDRGQKGFDHPAREMLRFVGELLAQGISAQDITNMLCVVPRYIVG
jgi:hypothetical protein